MKMVRPYLPPVSLLGILLSVLTGCSQPNSPQTAAPLSSSTPVSQTASPATTRLQIVTTFLPMYLFTKAVVGDVAEVKILVQPGSDVHEYQSKPEDVKTIAQANVLVKNGLDMETFLEGTIKTAGNSKLTVINASQEIKPLEAISPIVKPDGSKEEGHAHKDDGHAHTAGNPHIWLDPLLAKQQVEKIRDGLIQADPTHAATYRANAEAYIRQLVALDQEFQQALSQYRDRTFITFHDAFAYLAQRYGLKQVAIVAIPEDSLTPTDVKKTVDTVKQFRVKALLGEPGVDNKLLTTLSKDLNLKLQPLDSLESGQLDPQYYFTAMRSNLAALKSAFQ